MPNLGQQVPKLDRIAVVLSTDSEDRSPARSWVSREGLRRGVRARVCQMCGDSFEVERKPGRPRSSVSTVSLSATS